jgi:hypothetical protein
MTRLDVTPGLALDVLGDEMFEMPWPRAQSTAWKTIRRQRAAALEALTPEDTRLMQDNCCAAG